VGTSHPKRFPSLFVQISGDKQQINDCSVCLGAARRLRPHRGEGGRLVDHRNCGGSQQAGAGGQPYDGRKRQDTLNGMALVSDGLIPTPFAWLGALWLERVVALAASPINNTRLIVLRENGNKIGDKGASLLSEALKVYQAGSHRTYPNDNAIDGCVSMY
jgi:hypothetical protein